MTYEELLKLSDVENLIVKEKNIPGYGGRIYKNRIAIHQGIDTSIEKACVLAEEIGHYHTAVGDITDQSDVENRKQELKGRLWAYNQQIGLIGLVNAYKQGCHSRHEAAEYLGVTEEFFQDAIDRYRSKYGVCAEIDNYIVFFEPSLAVMEKSVYKYSWKTNIEEAVPDPEELEALKAYQNGDPEYHPYITHDELMRELYLDEVLETE